MSIQLRVRSGTYPDFEVNLDRIPTTVEFDHQITMQGIFPLLIVLVILYFFVSWWVIPIALGILATFYMTGLFNRFGKPNTVTFSRRHIEVREFGLLKDKIWKEDYQNFSSVTWREKQASDRSGTSRYAIIELIHPDTAKNIPLLAKKGDDDFRSEAQKYAKIFRLPLKS